MAMNVRAAHAITTKRYTLRGYHRTIEADGPKDDHALSLDASTTRPSARALRATRALYRLSEADASKIEADVREALEDWREAAKAIGIVRREIAQLETVIDAKR